MTRDVGQTFLVFAWRANCSKRFSVGASATLHCPDFTRDVLLDKELKAKKLDEETEEN